MLYYIHNDQSINNVHLEYMDQMFISGGVAYNTNISSGGTMWMSGGKAVGTQIREEGGSHYVSAGASAIDTKIYGGEQFLEEGGSATGTLVYSEGLQWVNNGARSVGAKLYTGGQQWVDGVAAGTIVYSKSRQYLYLGGQAVNTTVEKGGILWADAGTQVSGVALKASAWMYVYSASVTGGTAKKPVALGKNATIVAYAKSNMKKFHANASGAKLIFAGADSTLGSLKLNAATSVTYSVSGLKAKGSTLMLSLSAKNSKNAGKFMVNVSKGQDIGTYELSKNLVQKKGMAYTINLGTSKLGVTKLNGVALAKNGMTYSVKLSKTQVNLVIAMKEGKIFKKPAKGTADSDIFYGAKGNGTVNGVNGRDVAVYGKEAWGKDTIAKTKGTITILFKDLKEADVVQKLKGTTMTLTRKGVKGQSVTVQGWNADTHNVVFGGTMNAFAKWLKASKPTTAQTTAARNEVWKKAGLAQA